MLLFQSLYLPLFHEYCNAMLMKGVFRGRLNGILGFQTTFLFGFGVRTWGLWFIGFGVPAVRVGMAAVFQAVEQRDRKSVV